MLVLLVKVEAKYHYPLLEILVLGGIYEAGADCVLAPIMAGKPMTDLVLLPLFTTLFMVTYSPIVMTPTIALSRKLDSVNLKDASRTRRCLYGLLPLFGLIPDAAIFGILPRLLAIFLRENRNNDSDHLLRRLILFMLNTVS
ncbi:MAG: hypothetical protein QW797_02820 [Thermoproteota archaeon]